MIFLMSACESSGILKIIFFVKGLLNIVLKVLPIILMIMIAIDFLKAMAAGTIGKDDSALKMILQRILTVALLVSVPTFVNVLNTLLGDYGVDLASCFSNANLETIAAYEQEEKEEKQWQIEQSRISINLADKTKPIFSTGGSAEENDTSSYKAEIDFSKFDNCENNNTKKEVKGSNGKTVKIYQCFDDYKKLYGGRYMQNFAVTKNYIYFSLLGRSAWIKSDSKLQQMGKEEGLKRVSATYIIRMTKRNSTYQVNYVEFAGHAQSFDVANNNGKDELYLNYFSNIYKGSLGWGSHYVGVTHAPFQSNDKKNGVEIVPESSIAIDDSGKNLTVLKSADYMSGNALDSTAYYKKVRSIGSGGGMYNPELAVDEANDRIAVTSNKTVRIYKLSDFVNGKATLIKSFNLNSGGYQGLELDGDYFYVFGGSRTFFLNKIDINTGKNVNHISFNLGINAEGEGMSIYEGKVYVGCPNYIFLVTGF